jgi:UDP-glucose 4-epimerase
MKVLVTGGAGYIGSHVVAALGSRGFDVLVYDNLSTGYRDSLLCGSLVVGDLGDTDTLDRTIREYRPDAVMHFAGSIQVGESVREPLKYYSNNSVNTINLLESMMRHSIEMFIFSSTAAVYGDPRTVPITEEEPIKPINPYGGSKAFVENVLRDLALAKEFSYIALRYFNASGADPEARIGERHDPETHLIPLVLKAAKGDRQQITVYGTDYPTSDGTCVRDYIHVADLSDAHLLSLDYLRDGGNSDVFNCGYGHGHSVNEVIRSARKVTGKEFSVVESARRPGDPPVLVADSAKLRSRMNWKPLHDDLDFIMKTAWEWEKSRIGPKATL